MCFLNTFYVHITNLYTILNNAHFSNRSNGWSNFLEIMRKAHAFQTWPKPVGTAPCLHACFKDWTHESNGVYFLPELNDLGAPFSFLFLCRINEL
jgi:hypothetical protein